MGCEHGRIGDNMKWIGLLAIVAVFAMLVVLSGCNFGAGDMVVNAAGSQNAATESATMTGSSATDGGTDILGGEAAVGSDPQPLPDEDSSE